MCGIPLRPGRLYALCSGLFRSTDSGATWSQLALPLLGSSFPYDSFTFDKHSGELIAFSTRVPAQVSRDGGDTWSAFTAPGVPLGFLVDLRAVASAADGTRLLSASLIGLYKLAPGETTWRPVNRGFKNTSEALFAIDSANPNRLVAAVKHPVASLHHSEDGGTTWTPATSVVPDLRQGLSGFLSSHPAKPDTYYLRGGYYNSTASKHCPRCIAQHYGGATWTAVLPGCTLVSPVVGHPVLPHVVYASCLFDGLVRSPDDGLTWAVVNSSVAFRTLSSSLTLRSR